MNTPLTSPLPPQSVSSQALYLCLEHPDVRPIFQGQPKCHLLGKASDHLGVFPFSFESLLCSLCPWLLTHSFTHPFKKWCISASYVPGLGYIHELDLPTLTERTCVHSLCNASLSETAFGREGREGLWKRTSRAGSG